MSAIELVTFDCAGTILLDRWSHGAFARAAARRIGIETSDEDERRYDVELYSRWPAYKALNKTRDVEACERFWRTLASDWLAAIGTSYSAIGPLMEAAHEEMYGPDSNLFEPYDDVAPTLDALDRLGVRVAIISNWDFSLHPILKSRGLYDRFELVVASLEEGVEKPDPRLFHSTLARCGVAPDRAAHVGDHPVDDFGGATAAGMTAVLIDRSLPAIDGMAIPSLTDLPGVLGL